MGDWALTFDAWGTLFGGGGEPEPGLAECVRALPMELPLGVISNTGSAGGEYVKGILARAGVLARFSAFVFSGELGYSKPSREPFLHAAKLLHVEADHLIHIGDSPCGDVRGVQGIGGVGLLYAPDGPVPDYADGVVRHFDELAPLLRARFFRPEAV